VNVKTKSYNRFEILGEEEVEGGDKESIEH